MTPIDTCTHRVQHYHGQSQSYTHCCRCDECTWAASRRAKEGVRRIPAAPVHAHLELLTIAGLTIDEVGRRAGLSRQTVEYARGHETVTPRIASAILGVFGLTPFGCRRRIGALQVLGWTTRQIEKEARIYRGAASSIMTGRRRATDHVMGSIARAYEAMWRGPETPSPETVSRAAHCGYAPPLAWDDETIDDPRARPQGTTLTVSSVDDLVADLLELAECGESWHVAAGRVGYPDPLSLERRLYRFRRMDEVRAAFRSEVAA